LRRGQVAAKWLLDDDAGAIRAPRLGELLDHDLEHAGRDGEVVQRMASGAQDLAQRPEGGGVVVVPIDVAQQGEEPVEYLGIDGLLALLDAVPRALLHLVDPPTRPPDAHSRPV